MAKITKTAKQINYENYCSLHALLQAVREAEIYQIALADGTTRKPDWAECRQIANTLIPKEKYFQTKILDYLKTLKDDGVRSMFWKEASGFGYQISGLPDICGIINGRFYAFEVKRPLLGKVTPVQEKRIEEIRAAGGVAEVVCFVEEVKVIIKHESRQAL